jgi:hypothetical protein
MPDRFWVFDWLEDNHITSVEDAAALLPKYKIIENLRVRAEIFFGRPASEHERGLSIVAGTNIDLSGGHSVCPSPSCMRSQVDQLFKRVWHYFDRIVARDVVTPLLLSEPAVSKERLIGIFLTHLPPLLYLREIGAENLIDFVSKTWCSTHWEEHAQEQGLAQVVERKGPLTEWLNRNARYRYSPDDGHYCIDSPALNSVMCLPLQKYAKRSEKELQELLLEMAFKEHLTELTSDVRAAHELKLPLGTVVGIQGQMLSASGPVTVPDVVVQLSLPVLDGVSTKDLISVRNQEHESFIRFRTGLRAAIAERLSNADSETSQSIAEQVRLDYIEPALNQIRQRLVASEKALAKKSGVSIFLGAIATTCGLLCGCPPAVAVPGGVAPVVIGTGVAAHKYIEEQLQVSLEDMFFLWKATEHIH